MPSTPAALIIVLAFIVPGALYEWAYERVVGAWNITTGDRVLRFIGSAAILHVLALPWSWAIWNDYFSDGQFSGTSEFPWEFWAYAAAFVIVPSVLGHLVGQGALRGWRVVRPLVGSDPAPRAWDHLFMKGTPGWVRAKLRTGTWVAGQYVRDPNHPLDRGYAGGYPGPGDLLLLHRAEVDEQTGEWVTDDDGEVCVLEPSLLLRWADLELLEFFPSEAATADGGQGEVPEDGSKNQLEGDQHEQEGQ